MLTLSACGNKKEEKTQTLSSDQIIQQVDTVIAIGKVTAENGTAIIASNTSAMIQKIIVKEGDTVNKNDLLIELTNNFEKVDDELAKTKIQNSKDQNAITQKDLDRERIELKSLKEKLNTSKELFNKNAETKENYLDDQTKYEQQQQRVAGLEQQIKANQTLIKEQQLLLDKTNITAGDFTIRAPQSGTITNLKANIGQTVNSNETLGEIVDTQQIIIEAEVDELFADKIALNQDVIFTNINTKQILGKGIIIYTSPILDNKSILYETANEADDRRVLRIKIKPTSNEKLLINAKVECQIKIK